MTLFNGFADSDDFLFYHSRYIFRMLKDAKTLMSKNNGVALLRRRVDRFNENRDALIEGFYEWLFVEGRSELLRDIDKPEFLRIYYVYFSFTNERQRIFESLYGFFKDDGVFYDQLCAIEGFDAFRTRYFQLKDKSYEIDFLVKALSIMNEEPFPPGFLDKEIATMNEEVHEPDFSDRLKAPIARRYLQWTDEPQDQDFSDSPIEA